MTALADNLLPKFHEIMCGQSLFDKNSVSSFSKNRSRCGSERGSPQVARESCADAIAVTEDPDCVCALNQAS